MKGQTFLYSILRLTFLYQMKTVLKQNSTQQLTTRKKFFNYFAALSKLS